MYFKDYLLESLKDRKNDIIKTLFDGKTKRSLLIKSSGLLDKILGFIMFSPEELDSDFGLSDDAYKRIFKQNGFTGEEITKIRELVIESAKTVAKIYAKKYSSKITEIPENFHYYDVVNMLDDNIRKEFANDVKKLFIIKFDRLYNK